MQSYLDANPLQSEALSREILDAAGELACRIELGEFDDLDEAQMSELRGLSDMMGHWATVAQALEQRLALSATAALWDKAASPFAICN